MIGGKGQTSRRINKKDKTIGTVAKKGKTNKVTTKKKKKKKKKEKERKI